MKKFIIITTAAFLCLTMTLPVLAAGTRAKMEESIDVMNQLVSIPEKTIPLALLSRAEGIAIISGVIRAGFIIGGRYAQGVLLRAITVFLYTRYFSLSEFVLGVTLRALSSREAFLKFLIAFPIPSASSGNLFPPNKTMIITKMIINSCKPRPNIVCLLIGG